jgi:DNA ligase-1
MIYPYPTLYKRDSNGNIRELTIQYMGPIAPGTRSISGIKDGKLVESGWKETFGKNFGKKNATTSFEQAHKEAQAIWDKKLEKEYFEDPADIDTYDKFKPQLARDYTKLPQPSGYSQPKLDGIRCIARKDGLYTRAGKEITTCNHIHGELKKFFRIYPGVILDGELYNHDLKDDFNKITSLVRKVKPSSLEKEECHKLVQYHIYDCIDDMDASWTFSSRAEFIERVLIDRAPKFSRVVPTSYCEDQESLDELYSKYTEDGYEGQMVRNDTPYENKRSKNLLKRKEFITEEFNVVEVLEGQGNWAGYAKHFELELGDDRTFRSGVRGNQETLRELLEQDDKPTWVTCRYFEKTPDGIPRFPVVIDWGNGERTD